MVRMRLSELLNPVCNFDLRMLDVTFGFSEKQGSKDLTILSESMNPVYLSRREMCKLMHTMLHSTMFLQ